MSMSIIFFNIWLEYQPLQKIYILRVVPNAKKKEKPVLSSYQYHKEMYQTACLIAYVLYLATLYVNAFLLK